MPHRPSAELTLDTSIPWMSWMVAAQAGDGSSYERLLRSLIPGLESWVESAGQTGEVRDSVVKGILKDIHRVRHTYRPERPFADWVETIASWRLWRSAAGRRES